MCNLESLPPLDTPRPTGTAVEAVVDGPDVREDRVRALKAAIAAGTYEIDSRQLAAELLKDSRSD